MNIIAVTGNLCKDLELKYTGNNKSVLENTLAVPKGTKKEDGSQDVDFIDFVCFEKKADYLSNFAKKGNKIEVTGKLRTDSWQDKEGNTKTRYYIVADNLNILTPKQKSSQLEDSELPF